MVQNRIFLSQQLHICNFPHLTLRSESSERSHESTRGEKRPPCPTCPLFAALELQRQLWHTHSAISRQGIRHALRRPLSFSPGPPHNSQRRRPPCRPLVLRPKILPEHADRNAPSRRTTTRSPSGTIVARPLFRRAPPLPFRTAARSRRKPLPPTRLAGTVPHSLRTRHHLRSPRRNRGPRHGQKKHVGPGRGWSRGT